MHTCQEHIATLGGTSLGSICSFIVMFVLHSDDMCVCVRTLPLFLLLFLFLYLFLYLLLFLLLILHLCLPLCLWLWLWLPLCLHLKL